MFRKSLALCKNISQANFLTTPRFQGICIEQPKPASHYEYLKKNEEYKISNHSDNIFRSILLCKQEIYIDGPSTPIMEYKHKSKEVAKRERKGRRN